MFEYHVGKVVENLKGSNEGTRFDMSDSGATLCIYFNRPTKQEIEDVKNGSLQFKMFTKNNIIFILSKFGNMSWMDSPYHVALSKNLSKLDYINDGLGYSCSIILVDTATGEIKAMRYISFNTSFSRKLNQNIQSQNVNEFNKSSYNRDLNSIFNTYSTKCMVNYSEVKCRVK